MGGRGRQSNIDKLLEEGEPDIETLLGDSEILNECKWANQRLMA